MGPSPLKLSRVHDQFLSEPLHHVGPGYVGVSNPSWYCIDAVDSNACVGSLRGLYCTVVWAWKIIAFNGLETENKHGMQICRFWASLHWTNAARARSSRMPRRSSLGGEKRPAKGFRYCGAYQPDQEVYQASRGGPHGPNNRIMPLYQRVLACYHKNGSMYSPLSGVALYPPFMARARPCVPMNCSFNGYIVLERGYGLCDGLGHGCRERAGCVVTRSKLLTFLIGFQCPRKQADRNAKMRAYITLLCRLIRACTTTPGIVTVIETGLLVFP